MSKKTRHREPGVKTITTCLARQTKQRTIILRRSEQSSRIGSKTLLNFYHSDASSDRLAIFS
jgi:hypothetical protein